MSEVDISGVTPLLLEWRDGEPSKPWKDEWFIAETTYSDRVVLRSLPDDYTYDYTTADETYIKADKIKRWMPFPDSGYIAAINERDADKALIAQLQEENATAKTWLQNCVDCAESDKAVIAELVEALQHITSVQLYPDLDMGDDEIGQFALEYLRDARRVARDALAKVQP